MKKQPMRKCTGCGEMKEKRELVRIVKSPDAKDENGNITSSAAVSLDLTGKQPGRGAYLCRCASCFEKARKGRRLERSLGCKIPEIVYEEMLGKISDESPD